MFIRLLFFSLFIIMASPIAFADTSVFSASSKEIETVPVDTATDSSTVSEEENTAETRQFPPLEQPTVEESINKMWVAYEAIKYRFFEFMEADEERKQVLEDMKQLKDAIIISYNEFRTNPKNFLISIGITNPDVLNAADAFMREDDEDNLWSRKDGIATRIVSCKTDNYIGNTSLNAIYLQIPNNFVLLDTRDNPLKISFGEHDNVKNIEFIPTLPALIKVNNKDVYGYNKSFAVPFTVKLIDRTKNIKIKVKVEGTICNKNKCAPLSLEANRTFNSSNNLSSFECSFIKDFANKAHKLSDIEYNTYYDGGYLKIDAIFPYKLQNPSLFIRDYDEKGIVFKKPLFTNISDKQIKIISQIDLENTSPDLLNTEYLSSHKLPIILGYPEYFVAGEILPDLKNDTLISKNLLLFDNFITGLLLALFSPLTILLLLLLKKKVSNSKELLEYTFKQVLYAGICICIVYPILASMIGAWGEQFSHPAQIYFGIFVLSTVTLALLKLPNLKGAGFICALAAFAVPCNYLYELVTFGNIVNFFFAALGVASVFTFIVLIRIALTNRLPNALNKLISSLKQDNVFMVIMFIPLIAISLWSMLIIFFEVDLWVFIVLFIFIISAYRILEQSLTNNNKDYISVIFIILAAGFIPLFLNVNMDKHKDYLTTSTFNEAISKGQIIYTMADEPWCLTCRLGKTLFLHSSLIKTMINKGELVVLPSSMNNQYLKDFSNMFEVPLLPLNILYSAEKPYGEALPTLVENYTAKDYINKVRATRIDRPKSIIERNSLLKNEEPNTNNTD